MEHRTNIKPKTFNTTQPTIKLNKVEVGKTVKQKETERYLRRKRRKTILNQTITVVAVLFPRLKPLINLRKMPKNDAKKFMQEFAVAEGYRKWVLLIGAVSTFALILVAPEYAVFPPAAVFAFDAFIAKIEQEAAE